MFNVYVYDFVVLGTKLAKMNEGIGNSTEFPRHALNSYTMNYTR